MQGIFFSVFVSLKYYAVISGSNIMLEAAESKHVIASQRLYLHYFSAECTKTSRMMDLVKVRSSLYIDYKIGLQFVVCFYLQTKTVGFAQRKEANKHHCFRIIDLVLDYVIIRSTVKLSSDRFTLLSYTIAFRIFSGLFIKGNHL